MSSPDPSSSISPRGAPSRVQAHNAGPKNSAASITTTKAILLMMAAVACFTFLDTTAKYLNTTLPLLQVVWMRFVTHIILGIVIFRLWKNMHKMKTKRLGLQAARGVSMLCITALHFWALVYLQLAEAVTIMFAGPMVVAALAGPFMGEWAGPHRWAAIAVGFIGVLVVTRPGLDGLGWPALISVGAMVSFAVYSLLTRVLAQTENADGLIMWTAIIPAIALAPIAISVWEWPTDLFTWFLMFLTGFFGGYGHWLLIKAHAHAPAPTLAPFIYTQIVWMVLLGWLVFDDIPTVWTLLGAGITIAAGLYLLYRENVAHKQTKKQTAP
ncbi:MAG: DMT family transporter [Pseudomonadota bacterium]